MSSGQQVGAGTPLHVQVLEPRYRRVRDAFAQPLRDGSEPGAGLSVWRRGRPVVELSGGWQDTGRTRPWTSETLVMVYSTGKPLAALAGLTAVRDGRMTLDTPLVDLWPAYAAQGKGGTTLRHILSHTAGVPVFSAAAAALDPLDRDALIEDLAARAPVFPVGTVLAEHALTYGHLIDGVLRAVGAADVRSTVAHLGTRLGAPLWFGVPATELPRVADLEVIDSEWARPSRSSLPSALALPRGRLDPALTNSEGSRTVSFPADGLFTTASALARFYDDLPRRSGIIAGYLGPELHAEYLLD